MYVVQFTNNGYDHFLRNTAFTALPRAKRFETIEAANNAIANCKPFYKKMQLKMMRVVKLDSVTFASDMSHLHNTTLLEGEF